MNVGNIGKQYQELFDDELALIVIKLKKQILFKTTQARRSEAQEKIPDE
jgi:hypothetical protein